MRSRTEQLAYLADLIATLSAAEAQLERLAEADSGAADVRDAVGSALATAYFYVADREAATLSGLSARRVS